MTKWHHRKQRNIPERRNSCSEEDARHPTRSVLQGKCKKLHRLLWRKKGELRDLVFVQRTVEVPIFGMGAPTMQQVDVTELTLDGVIARLLEERSLLEPHGRSLSHSAGVSAAFPSSSRAMTPSSVSSVTSTCCTVGAPMPKIGTSTVLWTNTKSHSSPFFLHNRRCSFLHFPYNTMRPRGRGGCVCSGLFVFLVCLFCSVLFVGT